jgi:hypothetical protein
MPTFFCRLLPPRPTFAVDMTAAEAALMASHAEYWRGGIANGQAYAFGFVADQAGPFGMGVVEFESPDRARTFTDGDPVIRAGAGFAYEISLMPLGITLR